jgi:uncharacterized protein (TIGR04255 family)
LRYINEIRQAQGNPLDWNGLIAPSLIQATLANIGHDADLVRSMHQLHTRIGDLNLLMHYGIHNPEYPALVSRREFILDIDAFRQDAFVAADVLPCIDRLNVICEQAFEASIDKQLRVQLEPINE